MPRFLVTIACTAAISVEAESEKEALQFVEKARDRDLIPGYIFSGRSITLKNAEITRSPDWHLYTEDLEPENEEVTQ